MHDISIKIREKVSQHCGTDQEPEGFLREILLSIGFPEAVAERICLFIAHHHMLPDVDGLDWQILLESDFLQVTAHYR